AVFCTYVVDEAEHCFGIAVIRLECEEDLNILLFAFEGNDRMESIFLLIQIVDKGLQSIRIKISVFLIAPLIYNMERHSFKQESRFTQTLSKRIEIVASY